MKRQGSSRVAVPDRDEHELQRLSNGNYLVISHPIVGGVNLQGLVLPLADGGTQTLGSHEHIRNCVLNEVDATGTVVWTWLATDHLDPRVDCTWPHLAPDQSTPDGGVVVDVFHCNAIDVDRHNENLLVSARSMDSVFYVERPSGRILWKMGGSPMTIDGATYVKVSDPFYRQHDARLQPSWAPSCRGGTGQISLFDDQTDRPGPARAVVYDVRVDPGDGGAGVDCGAAGGSGRNEARRVWHYVGPATSESMGSFRILEDGSRVVGWGQSDMPNLVLTEVDVAGHDLLDVYFARGTWSYRAIKVPASQLDLEVLRRTAGQ